MQVIFTTDRLNINELSVYTDLTGKVKIGKIVESKSGANKNQLLISLNTKFGSEPSEGETLRHVCRKGLDYAVESSYKNIVFDTKSFADNPADISYVANTLTEELSDIAESDNFNDITVTVMFPSDKCDEALLNELDDELAKPIIQTVNHAYGDYGDPLKKEFEEFQKELSRKKTFREYLVDIMNQRGIRKGSEVYKPAGVSKSTFSKIINFSINPPYKPSKETVAALAIGLKFNLQEAEDFYGYAGFHLGETEFIDRVIRFFIGKGIYRIYDVNYCMIEHGYPPLGEKPRGDKGL